MAAAFGIGAGVSAISTILDDLVTAFKTIFNNIYRFVRPGWVITFMAGAPIALKYIDEGIGIAKESVMKWADALYATAANIFASVYQWVCNALGGCGGWNILQTAAASIAAALASGPVWLAAVILDHVVAPMVEKILEALKQIFNAIYNFVCRVLKPIVRVAIMAYVDYHAVKGVYRHMGDMIASWFSSWSPKEIFKAFGKTLGVFAAPLASGFIASYMYDYILSATGACGESVPIVLPPPPAVTPRQFTTSLNARVVVTDMISASILPEGAVQTYSTFTVPVTDSISATITSSIQRYAAVKVTDTISATIKAEEQAPVVGTQLGPYKVTVSESISATITVAEVPVERGAADALGIAYIDVVET